jgi:hypothetical protein
MESPRSQHHSEQTAREIDQEVRRIVDEALGRARTILETRKAALVAVAEELITREVIDAEVLGRLIEANSPSVQLVPGTDVESKRAKPTENKGEKPSADSAESSG